MSTHPEESHEGFLSAEDQRLLSDSYAAFMPNVPDFTDLELGDLPLTVAELETRAHAATSCVEQQVDILRCYSDFMIHVLPPPDTPELLWFEGQRLEGGERMVDDMPDDEHLGDLSPQADLLSFTGETHAVRGSFIYHSWALQSYRGAARMILRYISEISVDEESDESQPLTLERGDVLLSSVEDIRIVDKREVDSKTAAMFDLQKRITQFRLDFP